MAVTFSLLTPWAALVALLGAAGVIALAGAERRSRALCRALGLVPRSRAAASGPAVALVLVAGLVGLAAAQPVVATVRTTKARTDAEVMVVIDISRSMLARRDGRGPTRIERARRIAKELRASLPGVPVGVASLTDRVLPHLFPSTSSDVFVATVDRAVGVERPPPDRSGRGRATALGTLGALGTLNFFSVAATKRAAVVLTDGESRPVNSAALAGALAGASVTPFFVHVWSADERIYDAARRPLAGYLADPDSVGALGSIAGAVGGRVFDEDEVAGLAGATRAALGEGPPGPAGRELQSLELAPYAVLACFVPLLFLVWRRNLSR